jgi:hypothetical protein
MECVDGSQVARRRKSPGRSFDPAQESLGHRYSRDHSIPDIFQKQIPPCRCLGRCGWPLTNLALRQTRHLGNTDRGGIQAVRPSCQFPNQPSVGLVPVALCKVGCVEIQLQVRSCSRIRPLSTVSGPLIIRASRSGIRAAGRSEMGRISATGTPRFSIMKDSPSTTRRTISLVFRWSSRTVEDFMCHIVTHFFLHGRRNATIVSCAVITTYCFPSLPRYVIGFAVPFAGSFVSHSNFPVFDS